MPANLTPTAERQPSTDPRFRPGAYITDGEDLYYVQRSTVTPVPPGPRVVVVEDCLTDAMLELDYTRVARLCTLVRPAPDSEAGHAATSGVA